MKFLFTFFLVALSFLLNAQLYYNFSAVLGTYVPLTGGTIAPLSFASTGTGYTALDEGYSNNIPIGFSFMYDGVSRSVIHLNTNGFAIFGAPFVTDSFDFDRAYYVNNLTDFTASWFNFPHRPVIAPLWDDLGLTSASGLTYQTTGTAPNRIFTAEWAQVEWPNAANGIGDISFQLKLYETTNVVELIYQQEAGTVSSAASASIGITTDSVGTGTFISLLSTGVSPTTSSVTEFTSLSTKPSTGQVYRFTPDACAPPHGLRTSGYNNTSATIRWDALSTATSCQYAISTSNTPPAAGTSTTNIFAIASSLSPATVYYAHVSNNCGTYWRTISFRTASVPVATPFTESFETAVPPDLPDNWREENISDPSFDAKWETYDDASTAASGTKYLYVSAYFVDGDSWAYSPSLLLNAGTQYRLRFKYLIYDGVHSLVVKMGNKVGKDSMMNAPLFSKNDNNITDVYADTTISFTVPATGTWYIGFNYNTTVANANFNSLVIDDISITPVVALPVSLLTFNGSVAGAGHVLNWQTATEQNNRGFELQQSGDGVDFKKISFMISKSITGNSNEKLSYSYFNDQMLPGKNYYRLKQIDKDGKYIFSAIIMLQNDKSAWTVSAFPNPVHDVATIVMNALKKEVVSMALYAFDGRCVWGKSATLQPGQQSIIIPMNSMPAGMYRFMINGKDLSDQISIIKQ